MKIIKKEVKHFAEQPIVDIEISNNIKDKFGKWHYVNSDIIVVGTFYKNTITQFILKENKELFTREIITHLNELSKENKLFCLNERMEREGLFNLTKKVFPFKDVRKRITFGSSKERLFAFLLKTKNIEDINDPFKGDGSLCIERYQQYKQTKNESILNEIAQHNQNCLLKENFIFQHRDFLDENYS